MYHFTNKQLNNEGVASLQSKSSANRSAARRDGASARCPWSQTKYEYEHEHIYIYIYIHNIYIYTFIHMYDIVYIM